MLFQRGNCLTTSAQISCICQCCLHSVFALPPSGQKKSVFAQFKWIQILTDARDGAPLQGNERAINLSWQKSVCSNSTVEQDSTCFRSFTWRQTERNRKRQKHWQRKTELITLVKWIPNWHGWGESRYKDTQLGSIETPSLRLVQCEPAGREREEVNNSPVKWESLRTEKNRYLHEIPSVVYICETCSL